MAWCENPDCQKQGLRKQDVEFCDDRHLVLCHGCYALAHPGWTPPPEYVDLSGYRQAVSVPIQPKVGFAIQISDQEGLKARLSYGNANVAVHIPMDDIRGMTGI